MFWQGFAVIASDLAGILAEIPLSESNQRILSLAVYVRRGATP